MTTEKTTTPPRGSDPLNPAVPPRDLTGSQLGDFQILRRLGEGGMGQVYLAEQCSLKRKVALKLLKTELAANPMALKRFKAEAEAVARITHANIVQIYATSEADGLHYMALEFVDGKNLREYLTKKGPPDLLVSLSIMRQVAAALQRAAEEGIVHRDIKPDNILLARKGEVKVADFGLVRSLGGDQPLNLTQSGVTLGTPLYMSPEQVQGKPLDPRSDIYSFGVTCYHLLSGRPPFRGDSAFEVALHHVQTEPTPLAELRPDLPPDLCRLVHGMMAKDPAARPQSNKEIIRDLARIREALNVPAGAPGVAATGMIGAQAQSDRGAPALINPDTPRPSPTLTGPFTKPADGGSPKTRPLRRPAGAAADDDPGVPVEPLFDFAFAKLRFPVVVGLSLFGAFFVGSAGGFVFRPKAVIVDQPEAPESAAIAGSAPVPPSRSFLADRERLLAESFERWETPKNETQLEAGVRAAINLTVFYLENGEPGPAMTFFDRLIANPAKVSTYQALGLLGKAVLLARQGQAAESTRVFRACREILEKQHGTVWGLNPRLQAKIEAARAQNRAAKQGTPEDDAYWSHPGVLPTPNTPAPRPKA